MNAGARFGRGAALLGALLCVCLAAPGTFAAPAQAVVDPAAEIYDPGRMYVINLTLPPASKKALEKNETWTSYQPGTFSIAASADGTPDGVGAFSAPVDVGIRLKGSYTFRSLAGKSAFKVKFGEDDLFRGLEVLTLNNMVEDPSMIHETLAYTAYRGSGVPGSRTGYAYVYVNGVDYGIHLNIETMDRIALEKRFGPFDEETQHLYEGEGGADAWEDFEWSFEVDEGDEADLSDLEALSAAVNSEGPPDWATRVSPVIDLAEMTRMWAVEKYIGLWDGYAGQEEEWTPNNYYLYSDPGGRFKMLPWGNDATWQEIHHLPFDGRAGRMFDRCLDDAVCFAIYRQAVSAVRKAIAGLRLDELAAETAALLEPWQEEEVQESTREEHDLDEIEDGVAETREFIASRPAEAAEWLNEPLEPEEEKTVPPIAPVPELPPLAAAGQAAPPLQSFKVGRIWVEGGALHTQAQLYAAGTVSQMTKVSTGKGSATICRDRALAEGPRSLVLHCRLPNGVRERLRERPLGVTVATRFLPTGGKVLNVARRIVLRRG